LCWWWVLLFYPAQEKLMNILLSEITQVIFAEAFIILNCGENSWN
jgi:hypothetical protein